MLLDGDEQVHCVVQGRIGSDSTLAVLTGGRLMVCSDRMWEPEVHLVDIGAALSVQGWEAEGSAALAFQWGEGTVTVDGIADPALAKEFAQRLRQAVDLAGG